MNLQLVFLHGLESGPHGSKYTTLAGLGLGPVLAPDCTGISDPAERLAILRATLAEAGPLLLVGSSFGGLMAVLYAQAWPEQVAAMVLCAPAIHRPDMCPLPERLPRIPILVLQGDHDEVVPLDDVQAWCRKHDLLPKIVHDDHRLSASHPLLAAMVRHLALRVPRSPRSYYSRYDMLACGLPRRRLQREFVYERGPAMERWRRPNPDRKELQGVSLELVRRNLLLGHCQLRVTQTLGDGTRSRSELLMIAFDSSVADGIGTIAVPASRFPDLSGNWVAVAWLDRKLQVQPVVEFPSAMLRQKRTFEWMAAMEPMVTLARDLLAVVRDPALTRWPAEWFVSQLGVCARCGKELSDPTSQSLGVGPDCLEMLEQLPAVRVLYACLERRDDAATAVAWNRGVETLVRMGLAQARPVAYTNKTAELEAEQRRVDAERELEEADSLADRALYEARRAELAARERAKAEAAKAKAKAKAKAARKRAKEAEAKAQAKAARELAKVEAAKAKAKAKAKAARAAAKKKAAKAAPKAKE